MITNKSLRIFKSLAIVLMAGIAMTLAACTAVTGNDIPVTAITVSGAGGANTIDVIGGTLQMSAQVEPANATDNDVRWVVLNGTGTGIINSSGLSTALTNGTITVKATSVSTGSVSGTLVVTLTNQAAVDMDATLTDLSVDGITVMDFNPLVTNYVLVLSNGTTATPTTAAVKYASDATVVIVPATDVTSAEASARTTTITVTTADAVSVKTYSILFEAAPAPVDLGSADNFVLLAETGISTSTSSLINGHVGVSPAAATYITGFSLILDSTGTFATSGQVVGNVYASDYTSPTPSVLTTAIADMQTAYVDAAGRAANYTELFSGDLSGKTLTAGVYQFGTSVLINTDVTLTGSATDVWIFQIAGTLTQAAGIRITLAGGALAENIIWVVADTVAIGTGAHFEGTILAMTNVSFGTNASINGRIYAQTAITLDACTVVKS